MATISDCLRLATLVGARLCHDLSGLVGTVGGALELVADAEAEDAPRLTLASDAAHELAQRLRLYRAAWGGQADGLGIRELHALAAGLPNARSLTLETCGLHAPIGLARDMAGVLLNMVLLGAECLPQGGTILIAGHFDDLFLRIVGPRAAWPAGFSACLADPQAAIEALASPRGLQMPLTALFAHGSGLRLSVLMGAAADGSPPPLRLSARDRTGRQDGG